MRTFRPRPQKTQGGFGLFELMVAMVVLVVGVLAVAVLITYGIRIQSLSHDATFASGLAKARIETLRVLPRTDPRRAVGGSLTANNADHFLTTAGTPFIVRWVIAPGPADSQDVTVAVALTSPVRVLPRVQMSTLIP